MKLVLLVFVLKFGVHLAFPDDIAFRNDYIYMNDTGAFFKFHRAKSVFAEAADTCTLEGAHLYLPSSKNEAERVMATIANESDLIWIGAHDLYMEGTFVTLNGELLENVYSNWAGGQPDNSFEQDCVMMAQSTEMFDHACQSTIRFVCKRDLIGLTRNVACQTYDSAYFFDSVINACYKIHTWAKTWNEAYKTCVYEQADLLIINNDNEAHIISREIAKRSTKYTFYHVGFNDLFRRGDFKTVKGKSLSETGYETWAKDEPKLYESCGAINSADAALSTVDCGIKTGFICKKAISNVFSIDIRTMAT